MAETNETLCPEEFGVGIRNRVLGLNFCIEKLDEKITQLVTGTEAWKERKPLSYSMIGFFVLKVKLEDVKKVIYEILTQYQDACSLNKKEEEEDNVMKDLKELIIDVYKIKRDVDWKVKGLEELDHDEGDSSQDLTAKEVDEHQDRKEKSLTVDDDVMKFYHGESSQSRSFAELGKDAILTLSSSSTEEEITDEHERKDEDVRKRFLNMVSEAFSLSEKSENNDDVEQHDSDSDDEVVGSVEALEEDLMQLIIERGTSSGSRSENAEEEAGIF